MGGLQSLPHQQIVATWLCINLLKPTTVIIEEYKVIIRIKEANYKIKRLAEVRTSRLTVVIENRLIESRNHNGPLPVVGHAAIL